MNMSSITNAIYAAGTAGGNLAYQMRVCAAGTAGNMGNASIWTLTGGYIDAALEDCSGVAPSHISAPQKSLCTYCHGKTYDDARGNCGACGAPR